MASHVPTILSKHHYLGAFYSLVTTNVVFHNNPSYSTTVATVKNTDGQAFNSKVRQPNSILTI